VVAPSALNLLLLLWPWALDNLGAESYTQGYKTQAVFKSIEICTMQKKIPHHIKLAIHFDCTVWLYFARRMFWA
jgi:hypothetical protein